MCNVTVLVTCPGSSYSTLLSAHDAPQVYKTVLDACNTEEIDLPILEVRDVKKVGLVLVTGDRGLCGGYNSAVIKKATQRIVKLQEQGVEAELVLVGRKGAQWFNKRPTPIAGRFELGNIPQASVGSELANLLVAKFLTSEIDAAEIIYTRFVNLITNEPSIRTLLPLSLTGIESEEDECFMMTTADGKMVTKPADAVADDGPAAIPDYIFEDEPAEILNTMLTLYFSATIMRCMQVRTSARPPPPDSLDRPLSGPHACRTPHSTQ
jgi:F-type H+-transporting ATPase subunit gamma